MECREYKDECFGIYNTGVCRDCWIIRMTFKELLNIIPKDKYFMRQELINFYVLTQILTPDHPDMENIEFIFVINESHVMPEYIMLYVVFHHIEHCHIDEILYLKPMADKLSMVFETDEVALQEFNCNGEHLVLKLWINNIPNIIADILLKTIPKCMEKILEGEK